MIYSTLIRSIADRQDMKILLIQPILRSFKEIKNDLSNKSVRNLSAKRFNMPLGLLSLGTILKDSGHEVLISDLDRDYYYYSNDDKIEKSFDDFIRRYLTSRLDSFKPTIIGISGNFNTVATQIKIMCKNIIDYDKKIKIVVGGHYYTSFYHEILRDELAHYAVLGEGEQVMLDIVQTLDKGELSKLDLHPNLVTQNNVNNKNNISDAYEFMMNDGKQRIYSNPQLKKIGAVVKDLESLPKTKYELIENFEDYLTSGYDMRMILPHAEQRAVQLMTSRGCPHLCTYCASWNVHGKKIRAVTPESVLSELEYLVKKYDINTIVFEDDLFTYSRKRTVEMCKKIVERFGSRFTIDFPNAIAVRTLNDEVVYWLRKAGMKQINLAIESGNQYVQDKVIKKRIPLETVKPVVDILRKHGVLVRGYFILGFPGETIEMMKDTMEFARGLRLDWAVFNFAVPIAGSELHYTALVGNHLVAQDSDDSTYSDRMLKSDHWDPEDLKEIQIKANYTVNFLENVNLIEGNYHKAKMLFQDILTSYPKHLIANYSLWRTQKGLGEEEAGETEGKIKTMLKNDSENIAILNKFNLKNTEPFSNILNQI